MRKRDEALYAQLLTNCAATTANEADACAAAQERFKAVLEARRRESKAGMYKLLKIFGGLALVMAILVCHAQGEGIWYWIGFALAAVLFSFAAREAIKRYESGL